MFPYTPVDAFTDTDIYDLSDLVKGGSDGASNIPIKALLDRTEWLKNRLWAYDSLLSVPASALIDSSAIGKFIHVQAASSNVVITLDALSNFSYNDVLTISASCSFGKNVTVQGSGLNIIYLNSNYMDNQIFMHDGEVLYLLRDAATWTVIGYKGNFERVGECVSGYVQQPGTLIRKGDLFNRIDYPRLWKWINEKLTLNQQKVADITWLSDAFLLGLSNIPKYRGCFSTGDTVSTFRIPDDRGMYDRYLDYGRGMDNDRLHPYAGGYEHDMVKDFSDGTFNRLLKMDGTGTINKAIDNTNVTGSEPNLLYSKKISDMPGIGAETRTKNNAKFPLIIY